MDASVAEVLQSGSFDPSKAWNESILKGRDPNRVVSPLTAMLRGYTKLLSWWTEFFD